MSEKFPRYFRGTKPNIDSYWRFDSESRGICFGEDGFSTKSSWDMSDINRNIKAGYLIEIPESEALAKLKKEGKESA
jgi:hypothetical protein